MNTEEFRASLPDRDLRGIDSEFTFSTRRLVKSFKADGAHLNKWWVRTPVDWACPCCKRLKSQIVRLNKNNYLICHLHEHHDHMKEVVKTLFKNYSIERSKIVADQQSERFALKTAISLAAYDNTVICFDCNKADADAKKMVRAHQFFSFSPNEIALFIKTFPNAEHQIDESIAKQVWEKVEPVFNIRMQMAEKFARIAAEKQDWYQPSDTTAEDIERRAKYHFQCNGLLEIDKHEPERLLYNTDPFKGENSSWRRKINPVIRKIPSINELAHLQATRGKYWNKYNKNWICPCCFRKKSDCVRPSKNNDWVLEIKSARLFLEAEMEIDCNTEPMCIDCLDAALNLGREILKEAGLKLDFPSSVVTLVELSQVVIIRPHSKHNFKNELIDQMIPNMIERFLIYREKNVIKNRSFIEK